MAPPFLARYFGGRKKPPRIINTTSAVQNAGGSPSVPVPTNKAGDLLMMFVTITNGTNGTSATAPSGWSTLYNVVGPGNLRRSCCFYKWSTGSEPATVVPGSGNASEWSIVCASIRGAKKTPEASTPVNGSTIAPNPGAVTPSWGARRALFIAHCSAQTTATTPVTAVPTGYADLVFRINTGTARGSSSICSRVARTASEDPSSFTLAASASNVSSTIAII